MKKIDQVVDINLSNYNHIIDKFVKCLKIDNDIKRVNFIVFKENASYSDNIVPFMKKSDYLKKRLKEEKLMFNLVEANIKVCDSYAIRTLLTKNKENLTVVLLDAYGKTIVNDKWNKTNLFKLINKEVSNINHILKLMTKADSRTPVFILGMPSVQNETSKVFKLIHRISTSVYKEIIKKYKQVNYIETSLDLNRNRTITNAVGYNQLAYLLSEISESLYTNQTNNVLEKNALNKSHITKETIAIKENNVSAIKAYNRLGKKILNTK